MTHIPGSGTGGSVVLLHPNMVPSLPATLNALLTKAEITAAAQTLVAFDANLKTGTPSNL